jgi:hypothetical protein
MDTFLVRTLLVPSTVVLLGRWNWWPSKLTMDRPEAPTAVSGSREAVAGSGEAVAGSAEPESAPTTQP